MKEERVPVEVELVGWFLVLELNGYLSISPGLFCAYDWAEAVYVDRVQVYLHNFITDTQKDKRLHCIFATTSPSPFTQADSNDQDTFELLTSSYLDDSSCKPYAALRILHNHTQCRRRYRKGPMRAPPRKRPRTQVQFMRPLQNPTHFSCYGKVQWVSWPHA